MAAQLEFEPRSGDSMPSKNVITFLFLKINVLDHSVNRLNDCTLFTK
jgi:hypothetical protein